MTTTTANTTTTPDLTGLVRAIEARDAAGLWRHYAADATLTVVDRDHTPAEPQVYAGREIEGYYRDICGRNMEHQVTDLVTDGDRLGFVQRCRYPSGEQVLCVTIARLSDGLIVEQTAVQAWDV